jgi:hypothetical protein
MKKKRTNDHDDSSNGRRRRRFIRKVAERPGRRPRAKRDPSLGPPAPPVPPVLRERASSKSRQVGQNLYDLLGGRDEIVNLLPVDPKDLKASALRDALMDTRHVDTDGGLKRRFDTLYLSAGYSAKDLFELFDNRQQAHALVVASAAKPRLVGELVDAASVKFVPCDVCGGEIRVARTDEDGEFVRWDVCPVEHADERGRVTVDGNRAARELYFEQFGFKQSAPLVSIDSRQDNRRVSFVMGMPGTSPSPLALIKALELVPDVGASNRQLTEATTEGTMHAMSTVDAEIVEQ